jgi:integrase
VDCRAWLLKQKLSSKTDRVISSKTARDRFDYIKGFINFASRELELIPRNPWEGLAIEHATSKPRRPWSTEQLQALTAKPLFMAYDLPTDWGAGGDAAYWIPLIALFTGARSGELCQLQANDIERVDGIDVIQITDEGDKSLKTTAARRTVPIHSELIRLGFLEYAKAIKEAGAKSLFPALPLAPSKPSNYFSDWFGKVREVDGQVKLPDFHSLRHTVRSKLASAAVAEPMIDTLCGHEVKGSTGAKTYTTRTMDDLRKAIENISYPGMSLRSVFVKPKHLRAKPKRKRTLR